jgi:hypothetical protein
VLIYKITILIFDFIHTSSLIPFLTISIINCSIVSPRILRLSYHLLALSSDARSSLSRLQLWRILSRWISICLTLDFYEMRSLLVKHQRLLLALFHEKLLFIRAVSVCRKLIIVQTSNVARLLYPRLLIVYSQLHIYILILLLCAQIVHSLILYLFKL